MLKKKPKINNPDDFINKSPDKLANQELKGGQSIFKRFTSYADESKLLRLKMIAVLTKKKEYELWNEGLDYILSKYKIT